MGGGKNQNDLLSCPTDNTRYLNINLLKTLPFNYKTVYELNYHIKNLIFNNVVDKDKSALFERFINQIVKILINYISFTISYNRFECLNYVLNLCTGFNKSVADSIYIIKYYNKCCFNPKLTISNKEIDNSINNIIYIANFSFKVYLKDKFGLICDNDGSIIYKSSLSDFN